MFNFRRKTAEVFYCRHITQGISAYQGGNTLITKECLDDMNNSFEGKPVVITHKDWDKQEPVGYVVKSFYLPQDGYFWAEFIINDDNALKLIKERNFRVSNGYRVLEYGVGGKYHDIDYKDEVVKGEYAHLALTDCPKFAEAIILDRKSFLKFKKELDKIDNKFNEEDKVALADFFKKTKVANSEEILNSSFELDGKEFTVLTKKINVNEEEKKCVCCDGEYTVNELIGRYNEMKEKEKQAEEEKAKAEAEAKANEEKAKAEEEAKKEAEAKAEAEKKENEAKAEAEKAKLNEKLDAIEKAKLAQKGNVYQVNSNGTLSIKE